jgi:two-component system response regulator FixJ
MPGLSGLELQVRLRQLNQAIPIIFVTAHPDDAIRAEALREGAIAFLRKPFSADALLAAIHDSLASTAIKKGPVTVR